MLDYSALREAIALFHFPDPGLLSGTALKKLAALYDAYPLNLDNQSLCVLLPAKTTPKSAAQLNEMEAALKVIVLKKRQTKWMKIWPTEELVNKAKAYMEDQAKKAQEDARRAKEDESA